MAARVAKFPRLQILFFMTRLFSGTPFDIPPQCDDCGKLQSECACTPAEKADAEKKRQRDADRLEPGKQTAKIRIEKRKAKRVVTVVDGLTAKANDLPALLSKLQAKCGAGGTVKADEDRLELQGDHLTSVSQTLRDLGFKVR